jgi:hypothetical protein
MIIICQLRGSLPASFDPQSRVSLPVCSRHISSTSANRLCSLALFITRPKLTYRRQPFPRSLSILPPAPRNHSGRRAIPLYNPHRTRYFRSRNQRFSPTGFIRNASRVALFP